MPYTFAKSWGDTYNKANVVFSKDINTANKTDRKLGGALKTLLEDANRPIGFVSALDVLDKQDLFAGNAKAEAELPAKIKSFKAALDKVEAEKKKYVKVLDDATKLKPTIKDKNGYDLPTPIKDAYPDTYRQLKIMQTEVEAIFQRASNLLTDALNHAKVAKIQAEKNKAMDKAPKGEEGNAAVKAISNEAVLKTALLKFAPSFKSAMAKGAGVIQKIKASPNVATYNAEMNNGGRDISQNLLNLVKIKADAKFKGTTLAKKLPDPGQMARDIIPFANGDKRNLPLTATEQDVKQALTEFTALYKQIATSYADVISGKIK
jgi:hypothetical protein